MVLKSFHLKKKHCHGVKKSLDAPSKVYEIVAILAEELVPISSEYYLAFMAYTTNKCIKMLFSPSGGIDIEENGI